MFPSRDCRGSLGLDIPPCSIRGGGVTCFKHTFCRTVLGALWLYWPCHFSQNSRHQVWKLFMRPDIRGQKRQGRSFGKILLQEVTLQLQKASAERIAHFHASGSPTGVFLLPTKHTCRPQGLFALYDRAGRFRVLRV